MNFITEHVIKKIREQINQKKIILKHENFFWFNNPINDGKLIINRFNSNIYAKNEILPTSWYRIKGKTLKEIYTKIKNNDFYIYKKLEDGKSYKVRIKNESNKL